MDCEILTATMNQKSKDTIIERMGINSEDKCLIVNQITKNIKPAKDAKKGNHRFLSFQGRGLSKSRNHAIKNSKGDILILCDDDMSFVSNFQKIIKKAYEEHPDADIIAFDYIRADKSRKTMHKGNVNFLRAMKLSSAQITFKKKSILNAAIKFDENFGAGSGKYNWGEENIFLFDCLKAGLKIYYIPTVVRFIKQDLGSTWDKSNTPEHYKQQGAIYYRMSSKFWRILALQFVIRKRRIYSTNMSGHSVYKAMAKGAKAYKKELKNGQ